MQKMRIKFSEIPLALCREQPGVCGGGAGRGAASWDGVSEYCEIMTGTRGLHICDITSHHPDITKHPLTNHTQSIWMESTSIYNHFGLFLTHWTLWTKGQWRLRIVLVCRVCEWQCDRSAVPSVTISPGHRLGKLEWPGTWDFLWLELELIFHKTFKTILFINKLFRFCKE